MKMNDKMEDAAKREWYAEHKMMFLLMHVVISLTILIESIDGKFLIALWVLISYMWFIRAMESSMLAHRAIRLLDRLLLERE